MAEVVAHTILDMKAVFQVAQVEVVVVMVILLLMEQVAQEHLDRAMQEVVDITAQEITVAAVVVLVLQELVREAVVEMAETVFLMQ